MHEYRATHSSIREKFVDGLHSKRLRQQTLKQPLHLPRGLRSTHPPRNDSPRATTPANSSCGFTGKSRWKLFCTGLIFHRVDNGEYNAINIIRHIIVPKADDFVAERVQVFCSFFVVFFLFQMLTSIQFDDEFLFDAGKIGNVFANGMLPSKVDSQLVVADERP